MAFIKDIQNLQKGLKRIKLCSIVSLLQKLIQQYSRE